MSVKHIRMSSLADKIASKEATRQEGPVTKAVKKAVSAVKGRKS